MLQTGVSFARGGYWIEPIRPSVHLTGCDFEYLGAERVAGSYRPSLFVGILLAGEHTGFVDGHSIATTRVGVPMSLKVSSRRRSAARYSACAKISNCESIALANRGGFGLAMSCCNSLSIRMPRWPSVHVDRL